MQVKSDGDSLIGISLEFLSNEGEVMLVLLASHGNALLTMNQFSSKFNKVIMPHRVIRPESSDGWVLQENVIAMSGYTLTEIRTVCYKLRPQLAEQQISEYYVVLGQWSSLNPNFWSECTISAFFMGSCGSRCNMESWPRQIQVGLFYCPLEIKGWN